MMIFSLTLFSLPMPRLIFVLAISCLLVACQSPKPVLVPEPPVAPETSSALEPEVERFVFRELPALLRPYAYAGFCRGIVRCEEVLPYSLYVGMGGQFEPVAPVKTLPQWDIYRVRLDNGERYFFFANQELGGKYGAVSPIIPETLDAKVRHFKPQPLIACSDVMVTDAKLDFGGARYVLSGGRTLDDHKLQLIREVTAAFGANDPRVAEGLLALDIRRESRSESEPRPEANPAGDEERALDVDPFAYRVGPEGELVANDLRLTIRLNALGPQLYFKTMYVGEKRLNVRAVEFSADEQHWKISPARFQSSQTRSQVREWLEMPASPEQLVLARRMARAESAQVRFVGAGYYDTLVLSRLQKEDLRRVLALYDRLMGVSTGSDKADCGTDGDGIPTALE